MKVYLDIIFFINYIYDFIILLSTSIILKRDSKIFRLLLSSLIGTLSLLSLFISFNSITLFLFKILISVIMVIVAFSYKDIIGLFKELYYFYLISILLAGLLFFFKNQFSYNDGLIFFNSYKYNLFLGLLLSVVGIFIYMKNIRNLKINYNRYLKVTIFFKDYEITTNSYVDTGNKLRDPYLFKPIIMLDKSLIKEEKEYLYVPYKTCSSSGILRCIKANKIYIDNIGYRNIFLVGITDSINIDGVKCLLNESLLEG